MRDPINVPDPESVRHSVLAGNEISLMLNAKEGEWPYDVRTVADTLSALNRLLVEIGKGLTPPVKVRPVLTRVDILDANIRFTIRIDAPRKRKRRRSAPEPTDLGLVP